MIAVDTSALIAIIRQEPEAEHFEHLVAAHESVMSAVSLMEASFVLAGRHLRSASWMSLDLLVAEFRLSIVAFDQSLALLARDAFLRFGKGRHPAALNMGDCASYALATARGLPLLFKGDDFTRTDIRAAA